MPVESISSISGHHVDLGLVMCQRTMLQPHCAGCQNSTVWLQDQCLFNFFGLQAAFTTKPYYVPLIFTLRDKVREHRKSCTWIVLPCSKRKGKEGGMAVSWGSSSSWRSLLVAPMGGWRLGKRIKSRGIVSTQRGRVIGAWIWADVHSNTIFATISIIWGVKGDWYIWSSISFNCKTQRLQETSAEVP